MSNRTHDTDEIIEDRKSVLIKGITIIMIVIVFGAMIAGWDFMSTPT